MDICTESSDQVCSEGFITPFCSSLSDMAMWNVFLQLVTMVRSVVYGCCCAYFSVLAAMYIWSLMADRGILCVPGKAESLRDLWVNCTMTSLVCPIFTKLVEGA